MQSIFFSQKEDNNNLITNMMVIEKASREIQGGSGNATEFGRPQGKKPGTK